MRVHWEIARLSIQRQLTYRTATLAGLVTNFFFGLLRAYVMIALYGTQTVVAGISLQSAVTYTGLTQGLIMFLSLFSWYELMESVSTGEIAADLLKPVNYFTYWLARDAGRAFIQLILRGAPIFVFYALFFKLTVPQSALHWLQFMISLVLVDWLTTHLIQRYLWNDKHPRPFRQRRRHVTGHLRLPLLIGHALSHRNDKFIIGKHCPHANPPWCVG